MVYMYTQAYIIHANPLWWHKVCKENTEHIQLSKHGDMIFNMVCVM